MNKSLGIIILLLTSSLITAQNGLNDMKKFSNQLPHAMRGDAKVAYQGQTIDQMVYEFMEEQGIPGMTLAIVQAPYIPRVVGYGITNIDNNNLASVKTLWPIGPISQGFAAVAIMQLYESGKLDIHAPAGKYVNHLPALWKDITILELMQHSTGIADYRNNESFDSSKSYTPAELIAFVEKMPLAFEPGTDIKQSATNFLVLTMVVESASKMTYKNYVKENQIERLGLKETWFGEDLSKVKQENVSPGDVHQIFKKDKDYINAPETTTGYIVQDGRLVQASQLNGNSMRGFSDIWASAENVSFWDIGLAGSILISKPENRAIVYGSTLLKNGTSVPASAGWQFYKHKGLMDIKGSSPGHSAFLSRFTDASELVCVTLLANKENVDLTNLARRIAAAFDSEKMGTGVNDQLLYSYESQFSVDETMKRLEQNIKDAGIPVFAKFDHGKNATDAGLKLLPNQVIVFGSPKVGTLLMQQNPAISIELPLKISVWEDKKGSIWVTFPQMKQLASEYNFEGNPIIENMQSLLEKLVKKSASVY